MWQERAKIGWGWARGTMLGIRVGDGHRRNRSARYGNEKHNVAACAMVSDAQIEA